RLSLAYCLQQGLRWPPPPTELPDNLGDWPLVFQCVMATPDPRRISDEAAKIAGERWDAIQARRAQLQRLLQGGSCYPGKVCQGTFSYSYTRNEQAQRPSLTDNRKK